jgi:ankyrin repeat protein
MRTCFLVLLLLLGNIPLVIASNVPDGNMQQFYSEYFKSTERKLGMPVIIYALKNELPLTAEKLILARAENINTVYSSTLQNKIIMIESPLSISIEKGYLNLINFLINSVANLEQKITICPGIPDTTALIFAICKNREDIAILLVENGADFMVTYSNSIASHHASFFGMLELVNKMLDMGLDPLIKNSYGDTLLASLNYQNINDLDYTKKLIDRLIASGLDVNNVNSQGLSVINRAIYNIDIFEYLLSLGAIINENCCKNILFNSICSNQIEVVTKLLLLGCNPDTISVYPNAVKEKWYSSNKDNKTSSWGHSSLGWCALKGNLEIAKLLLESGANPDFVDWFGDTPIFHAVAFNQPEMTDLLIGCGVNLWYTNKEGLTPMDLAAKNGLWNIYNLLIKAISN